MAKKTKTKAKRGSNPGTATYVAPGVSGEVPVVDHDAYVVDEIIAEDRGNDHGDYDLDADTSSQPDLTPTPHPLTLVTSTSTLPVPPTRPRAATRSSKWAPLSAMGVGDMIEVDVTGCAEPERLFALTVARRKAPGQYVAQVVTDNAGVQYLRVWCVEGSEYRRANFAEPDHVPSLARAGSAKTPDATRASRAAQKKSSK